MIGWPSWHHGGEELTADPLEAPALCLAGSRSPATDVAAIVPRPATQVETPAPL
jgi:hypothetical protein